MNLCVLIYLLFLPLLSSLSSLAYKNKKMEYKGDYLKTTTNYYPMIIIFLFKDNFIPTASLPRFTCPFWGWLGTSKIVGTASSFNTVLWASWNRVRAIQTESKSTNFESVLKPTYSLCITLQTGLNSVCCIFYLKIVIYCKLWVTPSSAISKNTLATQKHTLTRRIEDVSKCFPHSL